jgi:hypothetical protein
MNHSHASTQADLPPIDSHRFQITPLNKSTSGKVYLFQSSSVVPKTGNLILLYENEKPVMAFRVLKNEGNNGEFVAKRVRRYDDVRELVVKKNYAALEKLGDIIYPPTPNSPPITASENPDEILDAPETTETVKTPGENSDASELPSDELQELDQPSEPQKLNPDPELDSETIKNLDDIEELNPEEEEIDSIEIEETTSIDPFKNILTVGAGYFANSSNFSLSPVLSNGFSISYAHSLGKKIFFDSSSFQDSLSIELGGIHYVILNKDGNNDQYTLFPVFGNLLYQLNASKSFTFNFYGGLTYNFMSTAVNPGKSLNSLQGLQPNFGIGAFYMIGPQWFFRADLGWDRITAGLSIKW